MALDKGILLSNDVALLEATKILMGAKAGQPMGATKRLGIDHTVRKTYLMLNIASSRRKARLMPPFSRSKSVLTDVELQQRLEIIDRKLKKTTLHTDPMSGTRSWLLRGSRFCLGLVLLVALWDL